MVRWMCGVSLKRRTSSYDLNKRLDVEAVTDVVKHRRLRWFGRLERKDSNDWVSSCRNFSVAGAKGQGKSKKTLGECSTRLEIAWSEGGAGARQVGVEMAHKGEPSNPCQHGKQTLKQ